MVSGIFMEKELFSRQACIISAKAWRILSLSLSAEYLQDERPLFDFNLLFPKTINFDSQIKKNTSVYCETFR